MTTDYTQMCHCFQKEHSGIIVAVHGGVDGCGGYISEGYLDELKLTQKCMCDACKDAIWIEESVSKRRTK